MSAGLVILGVLFSIIMVGLFVWILIIKFKEPDIPSDDLVFEHFLPQYTKGHSFGVVVSIIRGDKRTGVKFLPRDIDYVKLFKKKEKIVIKPLIIWIENSKLIYNPKGSLSSHRHKLWGLPAKAEDLSEEFKNSPLGQLFMKMTETANSKIEESEVLRSRIGIQNSLVMKTEGYELVQDAMNKIMEINKDLVKATGDRHNKPLSPFASSVTQQAS